MVGERGPYCQAGHRIAPGVSRVHIGFFGAGEEQWWCLPHYREAHMGDPFSTPEHDHPRGYWDFSCQLCGKEIAGFYRGVSSPTG